jgi:hypothetical protein
MVTTTQWTTSATSQSPARAALKKAPCSTSRTILRHLWTLTQMWKKPPSAFPHLMQLREFVSTALVHQYWRMQYLEASRARKELQVPVWLALLTLQPSRWRFCLTRTIIHLWRRKSGSARCLFATSSLLTWLWIITTTLTWADLWKASITITSWLISYGRSMLRIQAWFL